MSSANYERTVVIGDPQASLEQFLSVLSHRGLLSDDGETLSSQVRLISVGDHFDWGSAEVREKATQDGIRLLRWLADHSPEQVVLIAGNHDLGRIGELLTFSDEDFEGAHQEARLAYRDGEPDAALEAEFLRKYPQFPSAEIAARDFSAFCCKQRELVLELLRVRRFQIGYALSDSQLVCHAGVTRWELEQIGYRGASHDAHAIALALNDALYRSFAAWDESSPFAIPALHQPGEASGGEGGGMLYHRPANPEVVGEPETFVGEGRRRYDPRNLPTGLTQIIGHISDAKCRKILGPWAQGETDAGQLRHLRVKDRTVRYLPGVPEEIEGHTQLIFVDGGMGRINAADYQVYG